VAVTSGSVRVMRAQSAVEGANRPSALARCDMVVFDTRTYGVTCEMCAETFGGLTVESLLLLPDFHQNWCVMTDFSKSFQRPVSWESV
jgi:hypothetical protein